MESCELISIIIPIYKVEKYLDKCIKSVVNQTYRNLEIILVDDGSPDDCPHICDEWKKKDSRIEVIHKANGGLSDARNAGIEVAKGDYIGFVDSDDYIEKEMYQQLYEAIKSENADLAICNLEYVKEEGGILSMDSPIKNEVFGGREGLHKLVGKNSWCYVTVPNKLYSRAALKGIKFPVGKLHEDEFVIHKIFSQCDRVASIETKLYKYVQRGGSIMSNTKTVKSLDAIEAICERIYFYKENALTDCYPMISSRLKSLYISRRFCLPRIYNQNEKNRIKEIDKMFRQAYLECTENVVFKDRLMCAFPEMWGIYRKMRLKKNNKRGKEE